MQTQTQELVKLKVYKDNKLFGYERLNELGWMWMVPELNPEGFERWSHGVIDGNIHGGYVRVRFTGLKDKSGNEIYEGDILSYKSTHPKHEGKVFNNVVEFASGQSLCGWRMRNGRCVVKATPYKFAISVIIGNIYEHPHLLNQQEGGTNE